jgi:hypothetical protein
LLSKELGGGSDRSKETVGCRVLSEELEGGIGRSDKAVRGRSCRHSKSDACKERGGRDEKIEA